MRGFTLIELITAILLLGILAAVALPRFLDVTDDAEKAAMEGLAAALSTSVQQAHAVWQLQANGQPAENLQVFPGGTSGQIDFNSNGWPSQQWFGGIESNPITNNVNDCVSISNALLNMSTTLSRAIDTDITPAYLGSGRCRYSLVRDPSLNITYNSNTGEVISNF